MYNRTSTIIALILGALAVVIGAFGAHALKPHLSAYETGIFETASRYHFYHVLAVLIISSLLKNKAAKTSCILIFIGIFLFSGSLYMLSVKQLVGIAHFGLLGLLTPLGGLFLIAGWLYAALATYQTSKASQS